jgi:hypothetical protein
MLLFVTQAVLSKIFSFHIEDSGLVFMMKNLAIQQPSCGSTSLQEQVLHRYSPPSSAYHRQVCFKAEQ